MAVACTKQLTETGLEFEKKRRCCKIWVFFLLTGYTGLVKENLQQVAPLLLECVTVCSVIETKSVIGIIFNCYGLKLQATTGRGA